MPKRKLTWKDWARKYYAEHPAVPDTQITAVKHSLKKWEGLRREELSKYNLTTDGYSSVVSKDDEEGTFQLDIGSMSCALCVLNNVECDKCPLARVRGGVSCDEPMPDSEEYGPYAEWCEMGDAEPMIGWLKEAETMLVTKILLKADKKGKSDDKS